jgi:hypothetical protein
MGLDLHECVEANRVQTDIRWGVGVGASGGKTESIARVWRSLDVDKHDDVEPTERGNTTPTWRRRAVAMGGVARYGGGGPQHQPRRKTRYGGFESFPQPRGLLDPALATMHYSTATQYR